MTEPATSTKRQAQLSELMQEAARVRPKAAAAAAAPAANDEKFATIKENTFYSIMLLGHASLSEKKASMIKGLTYNKEESAEQNEKRLEEYRVFSEWLQTKRKEMAIDLLRLNDTEAFAQLKEVIDQLGNGVLEFNKEIQPFLDTLDAVYKIQLAGVKTTDMLAEIVRDNAEDKRLKEELDKQQTAVTSATEAIATYNDRQAELRNDTSWWTLGIKIKPESRAEIEKIDLRIASRQTELGTLADQIEKTKAAMENPKMTQFTGLEGAKAQIQKLLDISSPEWRENQKDLIQSATSFVETSDRKVHDVLVNIDAMNGRIVKTSKSNSKMLNIYAVMDDSVKAAMGTNQVVLSTTDAPATEEDMTDRVLREETREAVLNHIKTMTAAHDSTTQIYDALSKEKAELASMKDSNIQQINATRYLHTSGIANMGMQVNAVITALASAANAQSRKTAQELVDEMSENALLIRGKDSLRSALEFKERNESLEEAIRLAAQNAEVLRAATAITHDGLVIQKQHLQGLKNSAERLQDVVKEGLEVYATADRETTIADAPAASTHRAKATTKDDADDPFDSFKIG